MLTQELVCEVVRARVKLGTGTQANRPMMNTAIMMPMGANLCYFSYCDLEITSGGRDLLQFFDHLGEGLAASALLPEGIQRDHDFVGFLVGVFPGLRTAHARLPPCDGAVVFKLSVHPLNKRKLVLLAEFLGGVDVASGDLQRGDD